MEKFQAAGGAGQPRQPAWRSLSEAIARRKNRGAKQMVFAQMPVKLLEAGRAYALQAKPIRQKGRLTSNVR
jgi:hypothetical protein